MHLLKLALVLLTLAIVARSYDYGIDGQVRITFLELGEHLLTPDMYAHAEKLTIIISSDRGETGLTINSKGLYYTITVGQVTTVTDNENQTFLSNAYTSHSPIVFVEFIIPDEAIESDTTDITFWLWIGIQLGAVVILWACMSIGCYLEGKRSGRKDRTRQNQQAAEDETDMMP